MRLAETIMGLGSWVRQMAPFPTMQRSALSAIDANAVNAVASVLDSGANQARSADASVRYALVWQNAPQASTSPHLPSWASSWVRTRPSRPALVDATPPGAGGGTNSGSR